MNALVGSLLAALCLAGFARPRWWLSLGPVAAAIVLTGYRLATARAAGGTSEDAIALVGVVLLGVAMEAALATGALVRAGVDWAARRPAPARDAVRAARGIALIGLAFVAAIVVAARATHGVFALLSVAAVGVVLARVWRARLQGGRIRTSGGRSRPAFLDDRPGSPQTRRSRTQTARRAWGRSGRRARPGSARSRQ
jgi:hypothetical protein